MTLSRVIEWSREASDKRWVNIEHSLSSTHLGHMIWNPPKYRTLSTNISDLTLNTLKLWDQIHIQNKWYYNSPLIYLKDNTFFEPGSRDVGGNWIKNGNTQVKDLIKEGKIRTFYDLRTETDLMDIDILPKPIRGEEDYRPLEQLCQREKPRNIISRLYKILMSKEELDVPPYIKKWERELGTQCSNNMLGKILKMMHTSSVNIKMTETNFKCLAGWYVTPDKLSKFLPEKSGECWRGYKNIGTMAHIWWECPIIKAYWKKIILLIKEITNKTIQEDPWTCLFHRTEESIKQYQTSIVPILLDAAKSQIPKKWLEPESPITREWLFCVNEIYSIKCVEGAESEPVEGAKQKDQWAGWRRFKNTWSYVEEITG